MYWWWLFCRRHWWIDYFRGAEDYVSFFRHIFAAISLVFFDYFWFLIALRGHFSVIFSFFLSLHFFSWCFLMMGPPVDHFLCFLSFLRFISFAAVIFSGPLMLFFFFLDYCRNSFIISSCKIPFSLSPLMIDYVVVIFSTVEDDFHAAVASSIFSLSLSLISFRLSCSHFLRGWFFFFRFHFSAFR